MSEETPVYSVEDVTAFARAFADEPSAVQVERDCEIIFHQGGSRRRLKFDSSTSLIKRRNSSVSVPAYFAEIARLPHVANRQAQELIKRSSDYVSVPSSIDEVTLDDAVEHISTWCEAYSGQETRLLFVTGAAGSGKSTALRAFSSKRSASYESDGRALPLYINAQGSALSTLKNVVAGRLNDLRASHVYYESFIVLCRLGLLIPIIDGFDELLVEAGVSDSFKSLGGLLQDLEGFGVVIASSRREYYVTQNLHNQAKFYQSLGGQQVSPVELQLLPLNRAGAEQLIRQTVNCDTMQATKLYYTISNADKTGVLRGRPFLLRAICQSAIAASDDGLDSLATELAGGREWELLREVGRQFLQREARKWPSRSIDPETAFRYQWDVLEQVAEELWASGKKSIATDTLKIFAEELLPPGLSLEAKNQILDRWTSHAYLEASGPPGSPSNEREFVHSSFRYVFLGSALSRVVEKQLSRGEGYAGPLRQSFNSDVVAVVLDTLEHNGKLDLLLSSAERLKSIDHPTWRQNLSSLVLQAIVRGDRQAIRVVGASAQGIDWAGQEVVGLNISESTIIGLDVRDSVLSQCVLDRCSLSEVDVSSDTKFSDCSSTDVRITSLVSWTGEAKELYRDPIVIDKLFSRIGLGISGHSEPSSATEHLGDLEGAVKEILRQLEARPFIRTNDLAKKFPRGRRRYLTAAIDSLVRAGFIKEKQHGKSDKSPLFTLASDVSVSDFWEVARSGHSALEQASIAVSAWQELEKAATRMKP